MRVGIFGTGYAGLVTATDKDPDIVARLSNGTPTIHEPGLQELLIPNLEAGKLRFSTRAEDVISASDIIFLCVGTPPRADGRADLSQVAGFEYYSLGRGEATSARSRNGCAHEPAQSLFRNRDARAKFPGLGLGGHRGDRTDSQLAHD